MDMFLHGARTHVPIPTIWDSDELRHQECLVRIALAHRLHARRTDSPEAEALYRQFARLHARWLAAQQQQQQPVAAVSSRDLELELQLQLDLGGEDEDDEDGGGGEEGEEGEEDEDDEAASPEQHDQGWPGANLLLSEVGWKH